MEGFRTPCFLSSSSNRVHFCKNTSRLISGSNPLPLSKRFWARTDFLLLSIGLLIFEKKYSKNERTVLPGLCFTTQREYSELYATASETHFDSLVATVQKGAATGPQINKPVLFVGRDRRTNFKLVSVCVCVCVCAHASACCSRDSSAWFVWFASESLPVH